MMRRMMNQILQLLLLGLMLVCSSSAQGSVEGGDNDLNFNLQNCEQNLVLQDEVVMAALAKTKKKGVLIVLLRPGTGETSKTLTSRRLANVRTYFKERGTELSPSKIVFAEGDAVSGYGRIEYYLEGKLYQQVFFPPNGYVCHSCCGPDSSYFPDRAIRARKRSR